MVMEESWQKKMELIWETRVIGWTQKLQSFEQLKTL